MPWWGKADDFVLAYIILARIYRAQAKQNEAKEAVEKAIELVQTRGVFSEARNTLQFAQVKLWLAQSDTQAAACWTASQAEFFSSGEPFKFEDEVRHFARARVWLAQNKPADAIGLLSHLKNTARSSGRMGRVIEILLLEALAMQEIGDYKHAISVLEEGLTLAESEGYVRVFLEDGLPMQALLNQWLAHTDSSPLRGYTIHLISQFESEPRITPPAHEKNIE
jgi:LuxR family maltose regulon positive regulatory protein